jgi:cytochrome P450 family 135
MTSSPSSAPSHSSGMLPRGPRLPRAVQVAMWMADPVRFLTWCHRRGDLVTVRLAMSPAIVLTSTPETARRFLTLPAEQASVVEENLVLEPLLGSRSMLMLDDPDHYRLRQMQSTFFRRDGARTYEDVITSLTQQEVDTWPRGQAFRVLPRMRALTLRVILHVVFGLEDSPRLAQLSEAFETLLAAANAWIVPVALRHDLPGSPWRRFRRHKRHLDELLLAEVNHIAATGQSGGVLAHLLQARCEQRLTTAELLDQLVTLLVAGHETTATSLAWAMQFLAHNRPMVERLHDDKFLDGVVKETLRLRPIFPYVSRRLREPLELDRWTLPAGIAVGASIYVLHRQSDVYTNPEEFRPDRWDHLNSAAARGAWMPFGGGSRRCLGALFAQLEMAAVLRSAFSQVRLRPARPVLEPPVLHAVTLVPKHGATVIAERPD